LEYHQCNINRCTINFDRLTQIQIIDTDSEFRLRWQPYDRNGSLNIQKDLILITVFLMVIWQWSDCFSSDICINVLCQMLQQPRKN